MQQQWCFVNYLVRYTRKRLTLLPSQGMSLVEPKVVDVSCEDSTENQLTAEALATPANLSHHYLLVPAKLRLVTLAAFILSKCRVSRGGEKYFGIKIV